ncbi:MAG: tetratricopeptide repeat protein [Deltaproteobacteria bacterium]|nr:MAG: tetratricopeptide repeat protein [Deltaproteobacteria bacterium]
MNIPEPLTRNHHFNRYYRTWQKNPLSVVFISLAEICRDHGFLEEALEICEEGLQHNPGSVSGRLMLARIYYDRGENGKAAEITQEILDKHPSQREARSLLERIKKDINANQEVDGASEEITLVEKSPDKSVNLWENVTMAQIYADQGESKIARDILHRILKRKPQDERAQALLAQIGVV